MKVTYEALQSKYPCLVITHNTGRIILMTNANTGVCVCNPEEVSDGVGYYCTDWCPWLYTPYNKVITLQNN